MRLVTTDFAIAGLIVDALIGYAAVGLAVAVAFLALGLDRVDPNARGAYAFRPLLVPGLVLLWPLVLALWRVRAARPHRDG